MEAATAPTTGLEGIAEQFPILSRVIDGTPITYLDSGNTAQKPEAVLQAMDEAYRWHNANVHRAVYALGQEANEGFEGGRQTVADWIGASTAETIFTRNATEALNLVAYSWGRQNVGEGDLILLTPMEHHSNLVPWQILAKERGARLEYVPITDEGLLDLDALDELLAEGPRLLAVAHVSNVLGTINPIADIARRAHEHGTVVVVDGAQAAPHGAPDVRQLGADFYAFTGHKLYGPTGIGVLYGRRELLDAMPPFLGGGDMIRSVDLYESTWNDLPWKFEAGTSPIVQAVGLAAAIRWLEGLGIDRVHAHEADVVAYGLQRLTEVPGLTVYGPPAGEHRGTLISFALDGVHPHDVAELLGREQICVRAGHHCAQPLMRRLGVAATTRASFAVHNTRADVDRLINGLHRVREVFAL